MEDTPAETKNWRQIDVDGMFTVGHGVFIVALFGEPELGRSSNGLFAPVAKMVDYLFSDREGWFGAAAIIALQIGFFMRWLTAGPAHVAALPQLMFAPYGRIMILYVTLIAGGFLVMVM
ncbi:MAG: DUF6498-containing protein, partial [Burkholderiaceae bacterium]